MLKSLRSRLLATFLLPTLALLALLGALGYVLARSVLEDELGRSLAAVAASAATQVNGERLLTIVRDDDAGEGTRTYRNILRQLTSVREAAGARRIFAFDSRGAMRVDAGGGLPAGAEVPELLRDRLELAKLFQEAGPAYSQVLFEGPDGRLYKTGYAPVLHEGKVVAAIGVEGSAEFFGPLNRLFRGYAALVSSGLVLLALLAMLTARGLSRPLNRLMESALRIGRGDLATSVPPEPTLEIGVLARELETMRRALESRDRQLKMMLAGVAHEVRNPIGGIELFAGLLSEELASGPEEARAHIARIRKELDYLRRIVEDFLAFAREQKLAAAPLEAYELIEAAGELIRSDAQARSVELRLSAERATLEGDQGLLLSALVNLLKNAVQASEANQAVELTGRKLDGRYRVEVSDQGAGIPAEAQEKIFEPFFTTREKGTGLGLPLARKIVQAHRGNLEVNSRPGATTFRLELPLPRSAQGSTSKAELSS
ncbi:MAG: HAMP domain-containing protein [Myxococcales bacterium]|nr:HAMP domain-containing protein [Myxococcales bacterium]